MTVHAYWAYISKISEANILFRKNSHFNFKTVSKLLFEDIVGVIYIDINCKTNLNCSKPNGL